MYGFYALHAFSGAGMAASASYEKRAIFDPSENAKKRI